MARRKKPAATAPNIQPEEWKTGDQPATAAQESYLTTLAHEAGEEVPDKPLTKAEASERIDELQEKTGRGTEK